MNSIHESIFFTHRILPLIILGLIILFVFIAIILYKIVKNKYIANSIIYSLIFLFLYLFLKHIIEVSANNMEWMILIYALFVIIIFVEIIEKVARNRKQESSFLKLIKDFFLALFSISFCYSVIYYILFDINKENFSNVLEDYWYSPFLDFFYYSFSIMTTAEIGNITANTLISKTFITLEIASSFLFVIIIIANYQTIGDLYNKRYSNKTPRKDNKKEQD